MIQELPSAEDDQPVSFEQGFNPHAVISLTNRSLSNQGHSKIEPYNNSTFGFEQNHASFSNLEHSYFDNQGPKPSINHS